MTVTTCLVTRDHDQSLGRAIRSAAGLAGEVVVADTGSTDRTTAVAAGLGARVVPVAWADDFAAACNAAVAAATGDWVLWLNPDEEVDPAGLPALAAAAADPTRFAYRVRVRQELRPDRPGYGTTGWQVRLFRRDPGVRYHGRLHPDFVPPLEEIAAARGQTIAAADAVVRRHAYLSKPTPDKLRWVVRLLEAELRDRPGQVGFMIELGRNLLWLNDPRGHEVLGEAAGLVRQAAGAPTPPSPWAGSLIEYLLSVSPEQARGPVTRADARELAARWFPNTPPVVWAVAAERFAAEDYPAATGLLEQLVLMGRTGEYDDGGGFAPDIIGATSVLNLGVCYLHLDRWDDARACFGQLVADPDRRDAALRGYRLAELRQRPTG
ncbi:MAG: putative glycosyltransferase [Gemmataceae bacterium]|nr:putative glycosyltransferase [Gemmataceae bacterium]